MSSIGLNLCTFAGNLAADAQLKEVTLQQGEKRQVLEATLYVPYRRSGGGAGNRESFTVRLSIWPDSPAWRTQTYLKKGSLVICSGSLEPRPYISASDQQPKAGLQMTVFNIVLDRVRGLEEEESAEAEPLEPAEYEEKGALATIGQDGP